MKTATQILKDAIEIIERDGWHRGSLYGRTAREETQEYYDLLEDATEEEYERVVDEERMVAVRTAPVCAIGALYRACSGLANSVTTEELLDSASEEDAEEIDRQNEEFNRARTRLSQVTGWTALASWNDHPDTTKEKVVAAFRKALG